MRRFAIGMVSVASLVAGASAVDAATMNMLTVSGAWTGLSGGTQVKGLNSSTVTWGNALTKAGQSGYKFVGNGAKGPQVENKAFALGTFTHLNKVIADNTSITAARLAVTFTFTLGKDPTVYKRTSVFDFAHWETQNNAKTCANKGANGAGVNVNGCADHVQAVTNKGLSETFTIGTVSYYLDVTGFNMGQHFWTVEGKDNFARLFARFRTVDNGPGGPGNPGGPGTPPPAPVPLPAAGLLLAGSLVGLGTLRRRKRG